jgi:hypothetical protein
MDTTTRHLPLPVIAILALLAPLAVPRPADAAAVPADVPPFYGLYFEPSAKNPSQLVPRVAQFTPQGPIAGTFLPGPAPSAMARNSPEFVAVDPRGPTYYTGFGWHSGVGPVRFDPAAGTGTPITVPNPDTLSWPTGLAFDTTRNRLILSNLGGTGALWAYSPEQDRWSMLSSLNNVDMWGTTYSAAEDRLYALTSTSQLVRYTPEGRPAGTIRLDPLLPSGLNLRESQLIAAGDQLVLLSQPVADQLDPRLPAVQHSFLIDPHSGAVTALGPIHLVPEPATTALGAAACGAFLLGRRRRTAERGSCCGEC